MGMNVPGSRSRAALSILLTSFLLVPQTAWAAKKPPEYLPPMAPQVDSSAFQQKAAPSTGNDYAPTTSSSSANNDYSANNTPEPAPDVKGDRSKDLLRQALERHNQGDMAGAQRLFQQVLSIDPSNSDANFNLGAMAEDRGDLNGALRYYQSAARVNPNDSDVRDAINTVQDKMRQAQAAQQIAQTQQLHGVGQDAAAAYKAGKYDQAIGDLQQVLRQSPNDASALFGLGQAYRGKGDKQQARQYLARAVAAAPDNQLYRNTLSDLDRDMQQPQQQQMAEGPSPAPDYNGGGRHGRRGGNDYGDYGSNSGSDASDQGLQSYSDNGAQMSSNDAGGQGQITPFTSQGSGQLYGHEYGNSNYAGMGRGMGMGMGGMGMGSMLGMGLLSGGLSRMGGGYGYSYPGRGTRLVRNALVGSLAGAAMGGLMNMGSPGGARTGAMRGAMTGGLMGLITGF
jgi:tetratricopeptide (TPR) repeat protein